MTRKKYIKYLMAMDVPRNTAVRSAKVIRGYGLSYRTGYYLSQVVMLDMLAQTLLAPAEEGGDG